MAKFLLFLLAAGLGTWVVIQLMPDIQRYIKMSSM